jgi:hypothetical protein
MTLDQAIAEVQQICGWRSDKVAEITRALAFAQTEREKPNRTFPWFLRKEAPSAIVTSFNVMQYPIPSDYIQDTEELDGSLYILLMGVGSYNSRTVFLKKQTFEYAQVRYFGEWPYVYNNPPGAVTDTGSSIGPGVPIDYVLRDTDVLLFPPPDGVYSVTWRYWAQDAAQALGQENKWLKNAPWLLIGDAAAKIAADLGYDQGVKTAVAISQAAGDNLFRATINRAEAGKRRRMGSRL